MKRLLFLGLVLLSLSACTVIVLPGRVPPKFYNGQEVQTVENKWKVTIIGTACDSRAEQINFETCRYTVQLPFKGKRTLIFEEAELEEIK